MLVQLPLSITAQILETSSAHGLSSVFFWFRRRHLLLFISSAPIFIPSSRCLFYLTNHGEVCICIITLLPHPHYHHNPFPSSRSNQCGRLLPPLLKNRNLLLITHKSEAALIRLNQHCPLLPHRHRFISVVLAASPTADSSRKSRFDNILNAKC